MNQNPNPEYAVTKTYSLTMNHIGKVADMALRLGVSQGEVMRRAIDALYERMALEDAQLEQAQQ